MQITYTATNTDNGDTWTRTSGTMFYVKVLLVSDKLENGELSTGPYSWHTSVAHCHKAMRSSYVSRFHALTAVRAVPTAIKGKVDAGVRAAWAERADQSRGLERANALAIVELIDAKLAGKTAAVTTEAAETARKAKAAADRRRQRAAKKAREEEAAIQAELDAQAAARATEVPAEMPSLPVIENHAGFATEADQEVVKLHRSQTVRDGKVVWRNSGAKHNEYRRARRAALKAAKLAEQAS